MMRGETGFPRADVTDDFLRLRRRQVRARLAAWLRHAPDDVDILSLNEVLDALGRRGERRLGLQTIRLNTIVGTVDSNRDFDRGFLPTSGRVRERWERLALAQRRGEPIPPIEVYRVGDLHFVQDGHHRVSIAMSAGSGDRSHAANPRCRPPNPAGWSAGRATAHPSGRGPRRPRRRGE